MVTNLKTSSMLVFLWVNYINMMKNIWVASATLLLGIFSNVPIHAQDIFMGTLVTKDQSFYLKRCSVGSDEYLIKSKDPEILKQLQQLNQNYSVFWLSLLATAEYEDKILKLDVEQIMDVHPNRNCHLNQVLDDLSQLDTIEN
ncbi:hypothetical protein KTH71_11500 [Acinetobacter sp. WU_MDCI_Axc73]|nr:hypothetical protein [Acinetobacter sp. WU_MDCI_Axc73]